MFNRKQTLKVALAAVSLAAAGPVGAGEPPGLLYPDIVPYLSAEAPSTFSTLQSWQLSGNTLSYSTLFANEGQGLFEIRRGANVSADRYELLQRVYVGTDFGPNFFDVPIGTAPIPGTAGTPDPNDLNVIWLEDFTHFSLHTAPVVDGLLTVGEEVAGKRKTSWRLSANRGPLPGYTSPPNYTSPNQSVQQRISVGWADLYGAGSRGQFFDVTGVPVGPLYWLQQTVDPENRILESDETNNIARVLIDLRNPGEAVMFGGQFVQPGDAPPPTPGDLTLDGQVNLDDWLAFKASSGASLAGLDDRDRLALGDLNLDGRHSLSDAVLFREHYDARNGPGAFALIERGIPEPSALVCAGLAAAAAYVGGRRRVRRLASLLLALAASSAASAPRAASARIVLYQQDFEGLPLGPNVNETLANPRAWTQTPPIGWSVDDSQMPTLNVPTRGVKEWEGWSFADKDWWVTAAVNQQRGDFSLGSGTVAIADPDEWDDRGAPASGSPFLGYFNAWMTTPAISLGGAAAGSAKLAFSSSWRDECCDDGPDTNNQTAIVRASYDGGVTYGEALRWDSQPGSPTFKNDATNERVIVNLANPTGATSVTLQFGLVNAGNDWWWAIDNVELFAPTTLLVDVATGRGTVVGAEGLNGYEITSPSGALDPAAWSVGNFDAQNFGSDLPAATDFNNDGRVDAADYTLWRDGAPQAAGVSHGAWAAEFATQVGLGASWETVIAEPDQLFEFFLGNDSTFESAEIGPVLTPGSSARDLRFFYSLGDGQEIEGGVTYFSSTAAIPEPQTAALAAAASLLVALRRTAPAA